MYKRWRRPIFTLCFFLLYADNHARGWSVRASKWVCEVHSESRNSKWGVKKGRDTIANAQSCWTRLSCRLTHHRTICPYNLLQSVRPATGIHIIGQSRMHHEYTHTLYIDAVACDHGVVTRLTAPPLQPGPKSPRALYPAASDKMGRGRRSEGKIGSLPHTRGKVTHVDANCPALTYQSI